MNIKMVQFVKERNEYMKKYFKLLIVPLLVLFIVGCGNKDNPNDDYFKKIDDVIKYSSFETTENLQTDFEKRKAKVEKSIKELKKEKVPEYFKVVDEKLKKTLDKLPDTLEGAYKYVNKEDKESKKKFDEYIASYNNIIKEYNTLTKEFKEIVDKNKEEKK